MNRSELQRKGAYGIFSLVVLVILAFLFMFPLYWIVTGAFKIAKEYNSVTPVWFPSVFTLDNFARLFARRTAPLWELAVPFSAMFSPDKTPIMLSVGPTVPAAITGNFGRLMAWADKYRQMGVRTNADNPRDTAQAVKFMT